MFTPPALPDVHFGHGTGRHVKAQGIALGMFRKKRTKPCKGEIHAVKFQAPVLGQKATLSLRSYSAANRRSRISARREGNQLPDEGTLAKL